MCDEFSQFSGLCSVLVKLIAYVDYYAVIISCSNIDVSYAGERKQMACQMLLELFTT